jgi:hypothetical protein
MKILTNNISVAQTINTLTRWQVLRATDHDDAATPWMEVVIQVIGSPGAKPYPTSGTTFTLVAFDAQPSTILDVNAAPLSAADQLVMRSQQLTGSAYTTISAANTGTRTASRLAVEAACLSTGLVAFALAGT